LFCRIQSFEELFLLRSSLLVFCVSVLRIDFSAMIFDASTMNSLLSNPYGRMASNYGVAPATPVLPSSKDAKPKYSDQWRMHYGTYRIPRFTTISAFHASKMSYRKEAPNIMTD
jgi:hypothetical protein